MKLENQVSNLKLSKKLKELGVKYKPFWRWQVWKSPQTGKTKKMLVRQGEYNYGDNFPAFTVAELLELCPKYTEIKKCWPSGRNPEHFYLVSNVEVRWNGNPWMTNDDNAADALAKFLIYLLENKIL